MAVCVESVEDGRSLFRLSGGKKEPSVCGVARSNAAAGTSRVCQTAASSKPPCAMTLAHDAGDYAAHWSSPVHVRHPVEHQENTTRAVPPSATNEAMRSSHGRAVARERLQQPRTRPVNRATDGNHRRADDPAESKPSTVEPVLSEQVSACAAQRACASEQCATA